MIVAHVLSGADDGTYMIDGATFRAPPNTGFYDWRFGENGVAHPATCKTCGRKTDARYLNPKFRAKSRRLDLVVTYDGYTLVSLRFRELYVRRGWQGLQFTSLAADPGYFVARSTSILQFDASRRGTRFDKMCPTCHVHNDIVGATPAFFVGVTQPVSAGFHRSDLEFGSGPLQAPLLLADPDTSKILAAERMKGISIDPVTI